MPDIQLRVAGDFTSWFMAHPYPFVVKFEGDEYSAGYNIYRVTGRGLLGPRLSKVGYLIGNTAEIFDDQAGSYDLNAPTVIEKAVEFERIYGLEVTIYRLRLVR